MIWYPLKWLWKQNDRFFEAVAREMRNNEQVKQQTGTDNSLHVCTHIKREREAKKRTDGRNLCIIIMMRNVLWFPLQSQFKDRSSAVRLTVKKINIPEIRWFLSIFLINCISAHELSFLALQIPRMKKKNSFKPDNVSYIIQVSKRLFVRANLK